MYIYTVFTRVKVDPVYKPTPQKISFSYFRVRIFLKNLSFILEFSFRYTMVTWKKIVLNFFYLSFWPIYKSRVIFC